MRINRSLFVVIAVASVLLVGTIASWATGIVTFGGEVTSGRVQFVLEPVTYDLGSGIVSGTVRFRDTSGVNSLIICNPTPTFVVIRVSTAGVISAASISCSPSLETGTTIRWDFNYTVPSGYTFCGVGVTGNYIDSYSNVCSYSSSVGGVTDTDDIP
jgi:hypothetical protein